VDINHVLNDVVLKSKNEYGEITFNYSPVETSTCVVAESGTLTRVFEYIIKNAVQAIEDKMFLCGNEPKLTGVIDIISSINTNYFTIDFNDNGAGIKNEDLNNIFLPFFR
jgi:signal transduction histidine kinase